MAERPTAVPASPAPSRPTLPIDLPSHLGWHSARVTQVLRAGPVADEDNEPPPEASVPATRATEENAQAANRPAANAATVKIYPDIALGMLRQDAAASGRIWLLLRHLDESGRGWIGVAEARAALTSKCAPLRVCGWRQLRNLLARGDGIFWQRRNGRIWLRSVARVAQALHVPRLRGRPVALPVQVLTQGIGALRAHLFASFHSGRQRPTSGEGAPIARRTLARLSAVPPRTQRSYERRAGVARRRNFALGPKARGGSETAETVAWERGQAWFSFVDAEGQHGAPGSAYHAWQLPNSYAGPHAQEPRGRQKRINRELADLFANGMTGNGRSLVDQEAPPTKRFYGNGRLAAAAYNRHQQEAYWRTAAPPTRRGRIWYCLT